MQRCPPRSSSPPMEATSSKGKGGSDHSSKRPERKTVERNRRILMKSLFTRLDALLPHSKQGVVGGSERLDDATCYIRSLKWRLARLKERRDSMAGATSGASHSTANPCGATQAAPAPSHVEVRDLGSALEVVLVSGAGERLLFYEMVRVLEEEGAAVMNAGFGKADDRAFHSAHSLVAESSRGHEVQCIEERLKKLVQEFTDAP